jgi:RNAse (barnase) inhibitor barstar
MIYTASNQEVFYQSVSLNNLYIGANVNLLWRVLKSKVDIDLGLGLQYFMPVKYSTTLTIEVLSENIVNTTVTEFQKKALFGPQIAIKGSMSLKNENQLAVLLTTDFYAGGDTTYSMTNYSLAIMYSIIRTSNK